MRAINPIDAKYNPNTFTRALLKLGPFLALLNSWSQAFPNSSPKYFDWSERGTRYKSESSSSLFHPSLNRGIIQLGKKEIKLWLNWMYQSTGQCYPHISTISKLSLMIKINYKVLNSFP